MKKILIIGRGSIGLKHKYILQKINKNFDIYSWSSRKFNNKKKTIEHIKSLDPDYVIIASPSSKHFKHFNILEKSLFNKKILIEKPLFNKDFRIKKKLNNKYFVGYNLRFDPVLNFIKKYILRKKIFHINISCSSYLPDWRKKINYNKSVSAQKKLGGGVLLELSHEIDYLLWMVGSINIINVVSTRISNLKINTDDIFLLHARSKKVLINLTLNFFSRYKKREITVDGKGFSLWGDLRKKKLLIFTPNKSKLIKFPYMNINHTIKQQHIAILKNKKEKIKLLCSLSQARKVLNLIDKSRKFDEKN